MREIIGQRASDDFEIIVSHFNSNECNIVL